MNKTNRSLNKKKQCKLLSFEILDEDKIPEENNTSDEDKNEKPKDKKLFKIQIFGINEKRETFCIYLTDFRPFFPRISKDCL